MSNFINKIKKDSVLKDIQDARIEAIDSSVVENSVNPVEGGAVFTALAGKQDTLTAGSNINISNGVISATDTTYTAGTNIDITNGVISVVGELGVDDYNDLDNKPIINQDLEAVGFTPVANTYYKHIGTTGETYVSGKIYFYNGEEYKAIDGSGSGGTSDYFELENAPFKQIPEASTADFEVGDVLKQLYVDTSTDISTLDNYDWDNFSINNERDRLSHSIIELQYTTTEPSEPENYDYYLDNGTLKKYLGDSWITCSSLISISDGSYIKAVKNQDIDSTDYGLYLYESGSMNYCNYSTGSRPDNPNEGDYWYDTNNTRNFYRYDGSEWQLLTCIDAGHCAYLYDSTASKIFKNELQAQLYLAYIREHSGESLDLHVMPTTEKGVPNKLMGSLNWDAFSENDMPIYVTIDVPGYMAQGWTIVGGVYPLSSDGQADSPNTISEIYHTEWWSDWLKNSVVALVEGQYYKAEDVEESKEYLSDGMTTSTLTFDIESNPISTLIALTPDATFYAAMKRVDGVIYNGSSWDGMQIETSPKEPSGEEGMYWFNMATNELKQYHSDAWSAPIPYTRVNGEGDLPENPSQGDICIYGLMEVCTNTLFKIGAFGQEYYIISLHLSMEEHGQTSTKLIICLSQSEISTTQEFFENMEMLEQMSLFEGGVSPEGSEAEWRTGNIINEQGVMTATVTVSDIRQQSALDTFVYGAYTPASIGKLSQAIDGDLIPLATIADTIKSDIYAKIYSGNFGWNETSGNDPFKYRGSYYGNLYDDKSNVIKLDKNKNYTFEVINNDPVWFANQGFALRYVSVQSDGQVSLEALKIKNEGDRDIYIKITEGGI